MTQEEWSAVERYITGALLQPDAVVGLAGRSIPRNLSIDMRAAFDRLLHLFEHEKPCSLRNDKPVAVT